MARLLPGVGYQHIDLATHDIRSADEEGYLLRN